MHAVRFQETQQFRQWWIWVIILGVAALGWWGFIQQILLEIPFGTKPAPDAVIWTIWVLCGLAMPIFMESLRLRVDVEEQDLVITFRPFFQKRIPYRDIVVCEARTYHPIWEYGGWGLRWAPGRGWAYNVSGNQGVQLTLEGDKRILLGSRRPQELAAAINAQRRRVG